MTADLSAMLADLKTKADKATPGPWNGEQPSATLKLRDVRTVERYDEAPTFGTVSLYAKPEDAAFIAAADPQVVAALAEVAEAADLERWSAKHEDRMTYIERARILDAALARLRLALAGKENSDAS